MNPRRKTELKNTSYEIFIGILSILSIVNIVLILFARAEAIDQVLVVMNVLLSLIFLGDFVYRLFTAPSKSTYFFRHFGWADLLASLPFPQLKVLRIFRLVRVFRLMRELGIRAIGRALIKDRASSALYVLLLMGIFVLQFGSLTMLLVEQNKEGANITSAADALWYTMVTISTVGYGDQYPVSDAGRILGTVIIIVGVGIFGTFTGYLATVFMGSGKDDAKEKDAAAAVSADATPDSMEKLRELLAQSEANLAEMKRLVAGEPDSRG